MNNLEFSEKYLRRPVIVPSTEEVIGEIGVPLFDRKTGRMEWILIKEPAPLKGTILLEAKNLISVDENEVLVSQGPNMLYEYTQNMGESSLRRKTIQLIGRDAIDEGGIKIGVVSAIEIDPITLLLTSVIVVNPGGAMAFDRSKFYLSKDKVVIGRMKADIWTETISYEVNEKLQEKRKQDNIEENSSAIPDKAEKIDVKDCTTNPDSPQDTNCEDKENIVQEEKKPQVECTSLEDVRQRLNVLSSKIMEIVDSSDTVTDNKASIPGLMEELGLVKAQLGNLKGAGDSFESETKKNTDKNQELTAETAEASAGGKKEEGKKTRQMRRITISSLFFPKEDADRIQALDGYFEEGDVELKYPKGYEKRQQKLVAKKKAGVGKIIFSQIMGGSAFAVVYYILSLLKMV